MSDRSNAAANTPLADCAFWAVHNLAAKFRQPCSDPSAIADQIAFAARALRAYRAEVDGQIPADFLPRALRSEANARPLKSSIEELLVGVTVVTADNEENLDPSEERAVSNRIGDWLASACLRRIGVLQIAPTERSTRYRIAGA